jgi:hypothetical protein
VQLAHASEGSCAAGDVPPATLNAENAFRSLAAPQAGQRVGTSSAFRISRSVRAPHWVHTYS